MSKKKKNKTPHIYIEVLQNGAPIVDHDQPLSGRHKLSITSGLRGELALPLYPLPAPIELIKIHKSECFLHIQPNFGGFYTSTGAITDLFPHEHTEDTIPMIPGDYASLILGDLRILIRIGDPPIRPPVVKRDRSYAGSIYQLAFSNKQEFTVGLSAFFASAFLFLCGLAGFQYHEINRPQNFEQLAEAYTLPFIAPENISSSPEALQDHLNRDRYIPSIVTYYRNLIHIISGTGGKNHLFYESLARKIKHFWYDHETQRTLSHFGNNVREKGTIGPVSKTDDQNGRISQPIHPFPSGQWHIGSLHDDGRGASRDDEQQRPL